MPDLISNWCRHERCKIVEVHEAHDDDFQRSRGRPITGEAKPKRARAPRTRAQLAADPDRIVLRHEQRAIAGDDGKVVMGPIAIVQCPECRGGGCGWCEERGEMTLMRFHLWKRDTG